MPASSPCRSARLPLAPDALSLESRRDMEPDCGIFMSGSRPALAALDALEKQLSAAKKRALGVRHRTFLDQQRRASQRSRVADGIAAKERELEVLKREHAALENVLRDQQRTVEHLMTGSRGAAEPQSTYGYISGRGRGK